MPNQVAAAITAAERLRNKSTAHTRAPNVVLPSPTTKIADRERNQFRVDQARPMNISRVQKMSSALPGEGSALEDAAPATSTAPSEPTLAANREPARIKFSPIRGVSRHGGVRPSPCRKNSKSVVRVA